MHLDDDTPEPGRMPAVYPRDPPVNLLRGRELTPPNLFAFEGTDGSGKTTLARAVAQRCSTGDRESFVLRLGCSDVTSHALERAKWLNADPLTINLLNWVSALQSTLAHRERLGDPRTLLLADRYTLTIKVRGLLEGLDLDGMKALELRVPRPRRIYVVDAPPELSLERIRASQRAISYFEAGHRVVPAVGDSMVERSPAERSASVPREAGLLTHLRRAREAYLRLAEGYDQAVVVDNSGDMDRALDAICADIEAASVTAGR